MYNEFSDKKGGITIHGYASRFVIVNTVYSTTTFTVDPSVLVTMFTPCCRRLIRLPPVVWIVRTSDIVEMPFIPVGVSWACSCNGLSRLPRL